MATSPSMQLTVERWCSNCKRVFEATLTSERAGDETTRNESPCPTCGEPGQTLLQRP